MKVPVKAKARKLDQELTLWIHGVLFYCTDNTVSMVETSGEAPKLSISSNSTYNWMNNWRRLKCSNNASCIGLIVLQTPRSTMSDIHFAICVSGSDFDRNPLSAVVCEID